MTDGDRGSIPPDEPGDEERRWAHRIDPDLKADLEGRPRPPGDEQEEEPSELEPLVARIGGPYSAIVGVLFIVIIVAAAANLIGTDSGGVLGLSGEARGRPLAQFAAPEVPGPVRGDANIAQDNCASSRLPCPEGDRRTPACKVEGEGIIRVCDFFDQPLVVSFWFTRGGECDVQQDIVDRVARRFEDRVHFLSVNVRDRRETVERIIRERGWELPVAHDPDGAISNIYRVGGCPTVLYAYTGGITMSSSVGELDERQLASRVDRLVRSDRARASRSR